nr:hypothetical protein [Tanacetum cinerariifolium]
MVFRIAKVAMVGRGVSIMQGAAVPANHLVGQNTTPPLLAGQPIRQAQITFPPSFLYGRLLRPIRLSRFTASHSPHGSMSEFVHHFVNVEEKKDQESPLCIEPFVNLSRKPIHPAKEPVFLSETNADRSSHPLNNLSTSAPTSQPREILTGCKGVMAQTDMLDRFENLLADYDELAETHFECSEIVRNLVDARLDMEHNAKLYNNAISRYHMLKEEHTRCGQKVKSLEEERNSLSVVNRDQALWIKELEAEVAKKDFALAAAERMSVKGARERQKLAA